MPHMKVSSRLELAGEQLTNINVFASAVSMVDFAPKMGRKWVKNYIKYIEVKDAWQMDVNVLDI